MYLSPIQVLSNIPTKNIKVIEHISVKSEELDSMVGRKADIFFGSQFPLEGSQTLLLHLGTR